MLVIFIRIIFVASTRSGIGQTNSILSMYTKTAEIYTADNVGTKVKSLKLTGTYSTVSVITI